LEKAVELGEHENEENQQRVTKLHQLLRPFLLRRLKRDVEKDLPNKYEHLEPCPLSKRQRFLYDEFMARADTRKDLRSGNYHRIANILMQLRKVCNHPNLFEVRPVVTSFAMGRSVIADYEVKELLVRQRLLSTFDDDDGEVNFDLLGLVFTHRQDTSEIAACRRGSLAKFLDFPSRCEAPGEPPLRDTRTFEGYKLWRQFQLRHATWMRWNQIGYVNGLKCSHVPVYSRELLSIAAKIHKPILPLSEINLGKSYWHTSITIHSAIMSYTERARAVAPIVEKFAFSTPVSVAMDMPTHALRGYEDQLRGAIPGTEFDAPLHHASVKLRIAFPDPLLLQYDCGKLQRLALLLRERKGGGHRVLIFTQMTKILDILELFLNFHGYIYLRLDGATKIEDRQYITERFNLDQRVFCFISSSRSGGVGIKYVFKISSMSKIYRLQPNTV
jgi:helicase SWR1